MGQTLTGTTPQDTYEALIKVGDNGIITGSLKTLSDGEGNDTALALSTGAASVTGTLAVTGKIENNAGGIQFPREFRNDFAPSAERADMFFYSNFTSLNALRIGTIAASGGLTLQGTKADDSSVKTNLVFNPDGGNVGIGTNAPDQKLVIVGSEGTSYATSSVSEVVPLGGVNMTMQNTATGGFTAMRFVSLDGSNAIGYMGFANTTSSIGGSFVFGQRSGGGYAEQVRIQAAGGISFNGDTAAANALDDYEEGTWTPSLGGNTTYVAQVGTYTKIGRQVVVHFAVGVTTLGTGSAAIISGLPFTEGNNNRGGGGLAFAVSPSTAYASINPCVGVSQNAVEFVTSTILGVYDNASTVFTDGTIISGTITYFV